MKWIRKSTGQAHALRPFPFDGSRPGAVRAGAARPEGSGSGSQRPRARVKSQGSSCYPSCEKTCGAAVGEPRRWLHHCRWRLWGGSWLWTEASPVGKGER